jgi:hypothetical protein
MPIQTHLVNVFFYQQDEHLYRCIKCRGGPGKLLTSENISWHPNKHLITHSSHPILVSHMSNTSHEGGAWKCHQSHNEHIK